MEETEEEIRKRYRIISDPSWQLQCIHKGEWVTGIYCSSEEGAKRQLERVIKNVMASAKMTPEERMKRILR
jgi:hypothetical protein